jgi:hypothetical protein
MRFLSRRLPALVVAILLAAALGWAAITGSISGVVTDSSGAVVIGATVTATETQTDIRSEITTDSKGFYNFPALPIGTYDVEVKADGFKLFQQKGLVVDANSALRVDAKLQVGQATEKVTVFSDAVHVDMESTQTGEVIEGRKILSVPLNGRAYTDLLSLQPGVVPSAYGNQAPDTSDRQPSGGLNPGNQSVNGQRESSNGFMVNGANVVEGKNNGAAVIPNLDSIAEFRIITNNFDAEYGNYSGGQINVATKSGTNQFHGSVFEFLRNTALDAQTYLFNKQPGDRKGDFKQNQFGGTIGGPIKHDRLFFFADYQGTRRIRGNPVTTPVPSSTIFPGANGDANLLSLFTTQYVANGSCTAAACAGANKVNGQFWADTLSKRIYGVTGMVQSGEDYFDPTDPHLLDPTLSNPTCTNNSQCVFPGGVIPKGAISPVATNLLSFMPSVSSATATATGSDLFTSSLPGRLHDNKGAFRVDGNTRFGALSAYYFLDDYTLNSAVPSDIGANVPGFGAATIGRAQLITVGDTKTIGPTAVNEFHIGYTRNVAQIGTPAQGVAPGTLSKLGFVAPATVGGVFNGGIAPVVPALDGVPSITLSNLGTILGIPSDTPSQFNNMYQVQDNFTKVIGTHTVRFGGQFHYDQINYRNLFGEDGNFTFDGSETGADFADFLLGAVGGGGFIQASKQVLDSRSKYFGLFVQDSWRVKSSLTFNYGLRWEFSQPWYDTQNKIDTIVPGQQSVIFPNAPKGLVFPGDAGIPKTLAPTQYTAFSPRVGLAYSPNMSEGFLSKLTGGPGKTSIRVGSGVFYTAFEDLSQFQEVGDVPSGLFWNPNGFQFLEAPFNNRDGTSIPQPVFPYIIPMTPAAQKAFQFAPFEPLDGNAEVAFFHKNRLPYAEHFDLSVQRQLGSNTLLSVGYVGTVGHKLIAFVNSNPADHNLCLFLLDMPDPNTGAQTNPNLAPGTTGCGPHNEDGGPFMLAPGVTAPGYPGITSFASTRLLAGLNSPSDTLVPFGRNAYEKTIANSAYHSFQATLRHTSNRGEFLFGYTHGKCLDNSSGLEDSVNPYNPRVSRGLCLFDVTDNFVASYSVRLPFDKLFHTTSGWANKVAGGWQVSGITTFASGLPITISEGQDRSLAGSSGTDVPNFTPGKILNNTNPRSGQLYFNTSLFSKEALGQIGNSNRRFFHGPGLNNWDMALQKEINFTEAKALDLRFEAFNIFNHAQFINPDGSIDSTDFGAITSARDPRIMQIAAKFRF